MGNQNRLIFIPMRLKNIFNEATASEVIKDLDKVKNDLLKKVDVLVAKKKKLYSNVDIESPMSADEKKLDKEIADLFSDINQLVLQKRSLKKESVNEGLYFVGYNKGRGQGTGVFKDSYSSYKDAKKAVEKIEKERGGSYNQIAYYVADKDGKFVRESVNEEDTKSPEEILRGLKEMAMGDLERIEDYAEMISDRMKEGQELSSWMYSQITLAVDQLNSVHDAMDGIDGVKESVNEGREVKSIQSDFNKTVAAIETELLHYKKTKGTPQEKKHVDNLKKLHPIKKKLEAELERAVSGLYRDAELKIED
jgi:molybdopterin synthase catalytic subunit